MFKRSQLKNGIRIVTETIPHVRSVSIGFWLTVGSRNETAANNGISHFIEHMLFKGTSSRNAFAIAESLESVGGHINAFTGKELTCYYAHILDEHLPIAVDVISDILKNSLLDENEIEKEKQVVLEELKALEETPEDLIHELFAADLFSNHPLGYSTIGKRENIQNFKRSQLLEFIKSNYAPERMVIAAAGSMPHEQLVKLVAEKFDGLNSFAVHSEYRPAAAARFGKNVIENGAIQAHICLGTQSYSYASEKKFPLLVLNTLLGSGMSSRLFQNIRERYGLAYSVYSFVDFMFDTGMFGVYIGTDKNKIDDCIELITKELENLTKAPVSEEELNRTKSQLKGNLMLGLESTSSRMNRLAKMEIYLQKNFGLDEILRAIASVTKQEVLETARELFDQRRIFTTILKPNAN
jgi:predicted Zn-dependent peptidase